jgi:hypothetical protein
VLRAAGAPGSGRQRTVPGQRAGARVAERQSRSGQNSRGNVGGKSRRWRRPNPEASETKAHRRESWSSEAGVFPPAEAWRRHRSPEIEGWQHDPYIKFCSGDGSRTAAASN